MRRLLIFFALFAGLPGLARAELCAVWGPPEQVGALPRGLLPEASGMAASRAYPGRLYHHNDSGQGAVIHLTDAKGTAVGRFTLTGFQAVDLEDIAIAPCGAGDCVYAGDIGDNARQRRTIQFAVWPETETYKDREAPLRLVTARYPDGAHNAEGFDIHPSGELYLVTKAHANGVATQVFKLTAAQLATAGGEVQTLAPVTSFDLAALMKAAGATGAGTPSVTAFNIAPDGTRSVIMTYWGAIELGFDLSKPLPPQSEWRQGRDWRLIKTAVLPQAEAVTYLEDGKAILYGSESPPGPGAGDAPLYRQRCQS